MAAKKILSVGFELASDDVKHSDFEADISLLDWDIILFKPVIGRYLTYSSDYYQGKPSLSDSASFRLKERCDHWRREIKDSCDSGKTVIVFLSELQEVYVDTGERRYSGTGRNQKTTRIVSLPQEIRLNQELLIAEEAIEKARKAKEAILEDLKASRRLKNLLYEKGKPLENAIIDGLIVMGFRAEPFKDSNSEFDVVFESDEGRLIGEAEGKDSKAINIDKLRQLAMNIHEDLQREEVTRPAKGVLFGNGFRLSPLNERDTQFTEKCISAAQSSSTALLATAELFRAVHALLANPNEDYAKSCRNAILAGVGVVSLPTLQGAETPNPVEQMTGADA